MPLDARTWSPKDQVTASFLNSDLNSYTALQFAPTGVRFHAQRPLYKATQAAGDALNIAANTWRGMFQDHAANILVDNSGNYGAHMDPAYSGTIADALAFSNGNPAFINGSSGRIVGGGGGWYLVSAFTPIFNNSASGAYKTNIANGWTGAGGTPILQSTGTAQAGNAGHDVCPFVVDLINFDGGAYTPVIENQGSSSCGLTVNTDGSGETCYFTAQWASIYQQYGTAVSAPAPTTSWSSGSAITASLLNGSNGIRDVLRVLNMPPALRQTTGTATNCTTATQTTIQMGSPNTNLDTYNGWTGGSTYQYTVPMNGAYLCYGAVAFQSGTSTVPARAGLNVNGTVHWGPWGDIQAGFDNSVAKLQIFDLHAGDTVQLVGEQSSGSTLGTATNIPPVLIMVWLGNLGVPSPIPTAPDLSYRYVAGDQNPLGTFNTHLANDLNFLVNRPFLMSYQTVVQAVPQSTDTKITMDTVKGQIHGGNGDNYSGWDATNTRYVAQVPGWYLAVAEYFFPNSGTTNASTLAQLHVSTSTNTNDATDWYQHLNLSAANTPGGAAALGYYYLRAGDYLAPYCQTQSTGSGSYSTYFSGNVRSHFECIWVSE